MDGVLPFLDLPTVPAKPSADPIIVDSFAGGGGASTAIEQALGRSPDIAINHDPKALGMHAANHPQTVHIDSNIWQVDPTEVCRNRPVGLAWFSPDCTHHSKAKGGKPLSPGRRDLAWVVILWAKRVRPKVIFLENVEEFEDWGPLTEENRPCPERLGQTFKHWVKELQRLGYKVEKRELRACSYGAPTIRKRLFLIARCDGQPIVWPDETHAEPQIASALGLRPWPRAADIIDWTLPCPSIFDSREEISRRLGIRANRPLADATLDRLARGVTRYVLEAEHPFLAPSTACAPGADHRSAVAAFLAQHNAGARMQNNAGRSAEAPLSTLTTKGSQQQIVAVHLMNMHGAQRSARSLEEPHPAICAGGRHGAIVAAFLQKYYGTHQDPRIDEPMHTLTTKGRFSLVTVTIAGETYAVTDIGMRMLTPREQFRAQGFPETYQIDRQADGSPLTITEQTRMCGNSVSPPVARALVAANCAHLAQPAIAAE
jgi:DNA (cytosine-5)-methyltransferase 1